MLGQIVAGILVVSAALLAWRLRSARREVLQLRRQLTAARRDLEGARQAEQRLTDWQTSVGAANQDVLLSLDAEQHVQWTNGSAIDLFGPSVGKSLIEATRSYDLVTLVADAIRSSEALKRSVTLNGVPYSARTASLADGGIVLVLQDVRELQRLGRARREFVANISHELRTPLASIRVLVETLQSGALSDAKVAFDMLRKISFEVDALSQLARELLDLAMIESWQMPLKLMRTDLYDLARTQVERLMPHAQQKQQTFVIDIQPGTYALADSEMIGRVLANLLHNAYKFTPPKGEIRVDARTEGDNLVVSVADTGPGIPKEELSRIFERFYKVDRARGQAGTGLGLAIARHIVEGHGGRIWAESELGHGATFRFELPMG
jgi:two-component system phosphate regulon sensor histidine kinase PhoR